MKLSFKSQLIDFIVSGIVALLLLSCGSKNSSETSSENPLFSQQWHLVNTGQKSFSQNGGTSGEDLQLSSTIAAGLTGSGIKIAVSDSGTQTAHEDLQGNILTGSTRDYKLASPWLGDPTPSFAQVSADASLAHGTAVAGIIGALANNGKGGKGVAPQASLVPFRFTDSEQTTAMLVDQATGNFHIFNYSYGFPSCQYFPINTSLKSQMEIGATPGDGSKGTVYVKAAGNEFVGSLGDCNSSQSNFDYLGNSNFDGINTLKETLVVAALRATGVVSSYSSPGANIWVSAPGGQFGTTSPAIVTTDYQGCESGYSTSSSTKNDFESGKDSLNSSCNYTSTMNGTSSAAPNTSGAIALMLEANPLLTWRDIKFILAKTARRVDPTSGNSNHPAGANFDLEGHVYQQGWVQNNANIYFHNRYGFGAVDIDAAVTLAQNSYTLLGSPLNSEVTSSNNLNLSIPDKSAVGVTSSLSIADNLKIESVEITFSITHPATSDLGLELTSPQGTKSILMNINSGIIQSNFSDTHFITNAFLEEMSSGSWTLKVIDGGQDDTGTLDKWSIKVNGRAVSLQNKRGDLITKSPPFSIFQILLETILPSRKPRFLEYELAAAF